MGKKNKNKNKTKTLPLVSLCTPTFNRRPFIPYMIKCFEHQTYPKDKIEWIIIDDGDDPIEDLVKNIPQVKYFYYKEKMYLGKKRNLMHSKCSGDILIYMDDDDYYPPQRISHAVETLQNNPKYIAAGSSEMHIYFASKQLTYQFGPYGPQHSTAATFAFRKELLEQTSYNEEAAFAEEKKFLKDYAVPLIQLDTKKTIFVVSHPHNTLDKERLLTMPGCKATPSRYEINDFIKDDELKKFYIEDMANELSKYELGKQKYKLGLEEQLKKHEERRQQMIKEQQRNHQIQMQQQLISQKPEMIQQLLIEKQNYEKTLKDKTDLINQLLQKVKTLTDEINELKKKPET
jgi:glycosyltransferase involved in cell wall biosynthesis